ncbi:MAG: hypothetical protein QXU11_10965 [Thermoproteota archaeon]
MIIMRKDEHHAHNLLRRVRCLTQIKLYVSISQCFYVSPELVDTPVEG